MKRVVPVGVLILSAGALSCSRSNVQAARSEIPTVAVASVTRGDLSQVLTVAAEFKPYQEIDVHAKVTGFLKPITVDVGDHVKEGQLLAVLEVPELQNQMAEDEASIAHANDEITRAQSDLDRAKYAHDVAHLSAARLAAASKDRPKLIAQQDLDDAEGRDRQAEAQIATSTASLSAARSQLEFTKANQQKTRTLLSFARITAPFTGVITRRYADTGALIQAGTSSQTQTMPLVRLSQVDVLRLSISVPRIRGAQHSPQGARDRARAVARPHVPRRRIAVRRPPGSGHADDARRGRCAESKGELVPGMNADAAIALRQATGALTVPIEAIDRSGAQPRVFVVGDGNRVDPRPVQVDLETADRAAISGADRARRARRRRESRPAEAGHRRRAERRSRPRRRGRSNVALLDPQPVFHRRRLPDRHGHRPDEPRPHARRSVPDHQHSRRSSSRRSTAACRRSRSRPTSRGASSASSRSASGIDHMESRSLPGTSIIKVFFQPGTERRLGRERDLEPRDGRPAPPAARHAAADRPEVRRVEPAGLPDHAARARD